MTSSRGRWNLYHVRINLVVCGIEASRIQHLHDACSDYLEIATGYQPDHSLARPAAIAIHGSLLRCIEAAFKRMQMRATTVLAVPQTLRYADTYGTKFYVAFGDLERIYVFPFNRISKE